MGLCGRLKADDFILFPVIGPEVGSVEGQGAGSEGNMGQVFALGAFLAQVQAGQPIVGSLFVVGGDQVKPMAENDLAADLMWHRDDAMHRSIRVDRQDALAIPLADMELLAIETELRAGVVGAWDSKGGIEALPGDESANDPEIIGGFTTQDTGFAIDNGHAPGSPGGRGLGLYCPSQWIKGVDGPGLAGTHPEGGAVPSDGLRFGNGRWESAEFLNGIHGVEALI